MQSPSTHTPPLSYCLSWAWEKEKLKPGATQQAEQQLQEELEHWTAPAEVSELSPPQNGRSCPSRSKLNHFPPRSWKNLGGKGTLEVSCQTMSLKQG